MSKKLESNNATLEFHGDFVKKTLKKKSNKEKLERFKKECEILDRLRGNSSFNVVKVLEINVTDDLPWYKMKPYSGDSNLLLNQTKANVSLVAKLILPIVITLKRLKELDSPIYHRDLKPENLLYEGDGENLKLFLADFGCAYFKDSNSDRITLDFRAVGARAFLAPEYHHGRVEEVNEKGDIYSIGKLLWYYVNGIDGDVFPYTLWFPSEYDLQKRQPNTIGIAKFVSIIASCTNHDPIKRTNYDSLIKALNSIITNPNIESDEERKLKAKIFEQRSTLDIELRQTMVETLLNVFISDISFAFDEIQNLYGDTELITKIRNGELYRRGRKQTLYEVVNEQYDSALWIFQTNNIRIFSVYYPTTFTSSFSLPTLNYPFIKIEINTNNSVGRTFSSKIIWFYNHENVLKQMNQNNEIVDHNQNFLSLQLISALDTIFS